MILFFDTETNGLPINWGAHVSDVDNWPRMLQLAFSVYDDDGKKIADRSYLVKPEGFEINPEAAAVHGFTMERLKDGIPIEDVLFLFSQWLKKVDTIVAHNISFDKAIVGSEFVRNGMAEVYEYITTLNKICTMNSSTKYCAIPGPRGMKWPKLQELHIKLFEETFEGAHDAMVDVNALARCYFELKKRNIL